MAAKPERIKVELRDSTEGETRTFKIILTASNSDFQLADILRQRGVIAPIHGELKQAVKEATQHYLSDAEGLISTLTKVSTAPPKSSITRKRKDRKTTRINPTLDTASDQQQQSTVARN